MSPLYILRDDILARLRREIQNRTHAELEHAMIRAREELALIDALDAIDDYETSKNIGHPGLHPSREYERWVAQDSENRRMNAQLAIKEIRREQARRA